MRVSRLLLMNHVDDAAKLLSLVTRSTSCVRSELRMVFDMIDENKDETISKSELLSLVSQISEQDLGLLFNNVSQRELDFDSFVSFVLDSKNVLVASKLVVGSWRVVFVAGGPGSGKGTVCNLLTSQNKSLVHISAGDLLREEIRTGSALGRSLASAIGRGELVSAAVVMSLVEQSLKRSPARVILLDGFPRSLENVWDFLRTYKQCEGVLFFDCPEEEMVRRIVARGAVSKRSDDNEATARKRVEVFRSQSSAPLAKLRELGFPVWKIDSLQPAEENAKRILQMPLFKVKT